MVNTVKQNKMDALHAAIEAVRALGEGYVKMVDTLEDELYAVQQEVLAEKKQEIAREEHLYMMECFAACEEAKQNEKRIKTEIKTLKAKLTRMQNSGVWRGADYEDVQSKIVELTILLSEVWTKYHRMMYEQ